MQTPLLALALFGLLCAGPAAAADSPFPHYREFVEKMSLDTFYAVRESERDKLRAAVKVTREGHKGETIVMEIQAVAQPIRVVSTDTGLLDIPVTPELLIEDPKLLVTIPAGEQVSFALDLRPIAPTNLQTDYVTLMGPVPQANALLKKVAGAQSLFAPVFKRLVLQYDPARGQTVTIGEGESAKRQTANAKGIISMYFDETTFKKNPRVVLSELPKSVDFEN